MSPAMAVFTFIVSWWIVLFAALPLSIERSENPTKTEYAASPKTVRWGRILLITTLLAALVTALIALVIHSGWITVRDY